MGTPDENRESGQTSMPEDSEPGNAGDDIDLFEAPPYAEPHDSELFKRWRRLQHERGVRSFFLAILVFGGLALLYIILTAQT